MTRRRIIPWIAVLATASIPLALLARGAARYASIRRLVATPGAAHRAQVLPGQRVFAAPASGAEINLGYAAFHSRLQFRLEARAEGWITATSPQAALLLSRPFDAKHASAAPGPPHASPALATFIRRIETDWIAACAEIEAVRPASLLRLAWMGANEYAIYRFQLERKLEFLLGHDEVFTFTTPRARGIAWIGASPGDRTLALVHLSSLDGARNIGIRISGSGAKDVRPIVDDIVSSFRFRADAAGETRRAGDAAP